MARIHDRPNIVALEDDYRLAAERSTGVTGSVSVSGIRDALVAPWAHKGEPIPAGTAAYTGIPIANPISFIPAASVSLSVPDLPSDTGVTPDGTRFIAIVETAYSGEIELSVNNYDADFVFDGPFSSALELPVGNYVFTALSGGWLIAPVSEAATLEWARYGNADPIPAAKLVNAPGGGSGTTAGLLIATNAPSFNNSGVATFTVSGLSGSAIPEQGAHFLGRFSGTNTGDIHLIVNGLNSGNSVEVSLAGDTVPAGYITPGAEYDFTFIAGKWQLEDRSETRAAPWAKFGEPDPTGTAMAAYTGIPVADPITIIPSTSTVSISVPDLPDDIGLPPDGLRFLGRISDDYSGTFPVTVNDYTTRFVRASGSDNSIYLPAGDYVFTSVGSFWRIAPVSELATLDWARYGNDDPIPAAKLVNAPGGSGTTEVVVGDPNDVVASADTLGKIFVDPVDGRAAVTRRSLTHATPAAGNFTTLAAELSNNLLGYSEESVEGGGDTIPDPGLNDNQGAYIIEAWNATVFHSVRVGAPADNHWRWSQVGWSDALVGMNQATAAANVYWAGAHSNAYQVIQHFPSTLESGVTYFGFARDIHRVVILDSSSYTGGQNSHTEYALEGMAKAEEVGAVNAKFDIINISATQTKNDLFNAQVRLAETHTLAETAMNTGLLALIKIQLEHLSPGASFDNMTSFVARDRAGGSNFTGTGFSLITLGESIQTIGSDFSVVYGYTNMVPRENVSGQFGAISTTPGVTDYEVRNRQYVGSIFRQALGFNEVVFGFREADPDDRVRLVVFTGPTVAQFDGSDTLLFSDLTLELTGDWQSIEVGDNSFYIDTAISDSAIRYIGLEFDKSTATGNPENSDSQIYQIPIGFSDAIGPKQTLVTGATSFFRSGSYLAMGLFNNPPAQTGNLTSTEYQLAEKIAGTSKVHIRVFAYWNPDSPPRFDAVDPWQFFLHLKDGEAGARVNENGIEGALIDNITLSSIGTAAGHPDREYHMLTWEVPLPEGNTSDYAEWEIYTPVGATSETVNAMTVTQAFSITF